MNLPVDIVIYPGFKALEAIGALSVFTYANVHLEKRGRHERYDAKLVSTAAGPVISDTGAPFVAEKRPATSDYSHTLIVVGAWNVEVVLTRESALVSWLARTSTRFTRIAALCSGAFFLAEAGLLNKRRATTHWAVAETLRAAYPTIIVEPDCIFVRDGDVWTSAGVTAGIDLTLALVEDDMGLDIALDVARDLVVYLKRPGGQAQFSAHLDSQLTHHPTIRDVQGWILSNLNQQLTASAMAAKVAMSVRTFNRCFRQETGTTPLAFVKRARVEAARRLLEEGTLPAKTIASRVGFTEYDAMRRAFLQTLGVTPLVYRERFGVRHHRADAREAE